MNLISAKDIIGSRALVESDLTVRLMHSGLPNSPS